MKILYGVQATGNGHISRSREVVRELKALGNSVTTLFSGREEKELWDVSDFQPYTVRRGLTFITRKGKIDYLRTALQLNVVCFLRDVFSFDVSSFDVVITDFEPVSAYAALRKKKPVIGIGHQYAFYHSIPLAGKNPFAKLIIKRFAPATCPVGLHWSAFGTPVLPPIVPQMDMRENRIIDKKILVYLPFEDQEEVNKLLSRFSDFSFFIYFSRDREEIKENLHLRTFSRKNFLADLQDCSGVICNAGFELPSEALQLRKKVLVRPLTGQFEQETNALSFEKLGLGTVMRNLDKDVILRWLQSSARPEVRYPNVARFIAEWITSANFDDIEGLSEKVWNETISGICKS